MRYAFQFRKWRKGARAFLLIPIMVFLWCVGWSLYWIGSKRETTLPKPKLPVQKELIIFADTRTEIRNLTMVASAR